MSLTLSGSGTIGGLVAGGLPDATVTAADLASGAARTNFGAGAVLQVVNATYSTQVDTTSTSFVATGLAASITPSAVSSKVLIAVTLPSGSSTSLNSVIFTVFRGSVSGTNLGEANFGFGYSYSGASAVYGVASCSYVDSPSTTASTTYTVGFRSVTGSIVNSCPANAKATITLMEIAG